MNKGFTGLYRDGKGKTTAVLAWDYGPLSEI